MEPGHEDREDQVGRVQVKGAVGGRNGARSRRPGRPLDLAAEQRTQLWAAMEPGHEDREDGLAVDRPVAGVAAAMEPGHEDREDPILVADFAVICAAAMEPGHEDREDASLIGATSGAKLSPQGSPVMKTGKTTRRNPHLRPHIRAAME